MVEPFSKRGAVTGPTLRDPCLGATTAKANALAFTDSGFPPITV